LYTSFLVCQTQICILINISIDVIDDYVLYNSPVTTNYSYLIYVLHCTDDDYILAITGHLLKRYNFLSITFFLCLNVRLVLCPHFRVTL
jgi:hypothetical protein